MNNPKGIDVSDIGQGRFDWQQWRGQISFAMCKATEGTDFVDPEFHRNWNEMADIGAFRFAYHYFHPNLDPVAQAHFFMDTVLSMEQLRGDNLVNDCETADGMAPIDVSFAAWVFQHTCNEDAHHHRCLTYTYPYFAEQGNCAKLGGWMLWVADYGVPAPWTPPPWSRWAFWQYASGGTKRPDLDVFNGTEKELEEFCTTTGPWPR